MVDSVKFLLWGCMKIKLFLLSIWGYVLCRCVIQDFELRLQFRCVPWNCRQMQPQFWSQTSQKPWHYGWSHGCIVFICCGVMIVRKLTASRFSFVSTVEVVYVHISGSSLIIISSLVLCCFTPEFIWGARVMLNWPWKICDLSL